MPTIVHSKPILEQSPIVFMHRIVNSSRAMMTQSDVSSVNVKSYDITNRSSPVLKQDLNLTITDVIHDTLKTASTSAYDLDDTGANFYYEGPGILIPEGNKKYQIEFTITPSAGAPVRLVWQIRTTSLFSV